MSDPKPPSEAETFFRDMAEVMRDDSDGSPSLPAVAEVLDRQADREAEKDGSKS